MRATSRLRPHSHNPCFVGQARLSVIPAIILQRPSPVQCVKRQYAQPAKLNIQGTKIVFKHPPPPPPPATETTTVEDAHTPGEAESTPGAFDDFLAETAVSLRSQDSVSIDYLYHDYREKGGRMCEYIIPYEERPSEQRRADAPLNDDADRGDGLVMVVHVLFNSSGKLDKVCACSGFVVDAQPTNGGEQAGEVVVTCAHTLEEIYRHMNRPVKSIEDAKSRNRKQSMSFIIPSHGKARRVRHILSSMPRSDTIAMQLDVSHDPPAARLRSLPLTPFPVHSGMTVLTHLFGASDVPEVTRSQSRLPQSAMTYADRDQAEKPIEWLDGYAWRRWGAGNMLGYRSYTNIEVEAGIHSSLPHILTSILPTPGSSGGPLINAETGAVVGMISGRRMDNRVEGERGWGASSESIFEMFSLPGFTPTHVSRR